MARGERHRRLRLRHALGPHHAPVPRPPRRGAAQSARPHEDAQPADRLDRPARRPRARPRRQRAHGVPARARAAGLGVRRRRRHAREAGSSCPRARTPSPSSIACSTGRPRSACGCAPRSTCAPTRDRWGRSCRRTRSRSPRSASSCAAVIPYPPLRMYVSGPRTSFVFESSERRMVEYALEAARGYDSRGVLWSRGRFDITLERARPGDLRGLRRGLGDPAGPRLRRAARLRARAPPGPAPARRARGPRRRRRQPRAGRRSVRDHARGPRRR